MKKLQIVFIALFFVLLLLPIVHFNWEENVVSEIDNRKLTNNPFGPNAVQGADLTAQLESYVQDRIGFRDQMILNYTLLNDKLFHKMIHPLYEYGKDGYVFSKQKANIKLNDYHIAFADMLLEIQTYCEERSVPFLFVFDPEKAAVYTDELHEGIHYDNSWVQQFEAELDKRGVHYINNTQLMKDKRAQGQQVFNKMYNAGHWNDLGAFYGINNVLEELSKDFPQISPNEMDDFVISEKLNETLISSQFPIHEYEPIFGRTCPLEVKTPEYDAEVKRNSQHRGFGYYINPENQAAGAPKTLVFQGSYLNEMGFKFLQTGLGEYIHVHNYENVLDFAYYFNIFQPECVVVEAAEYTINPTYFNEKNLKSFSLNPKLDNSTPAQQKKLTELSPKIEQGNQLATVSVCLPENVQYAYLECGDRVFDLLEEGGVYKASFEKAWLDEENLSVIVVDTRGEKISYQ